MVNLPDWIKMVLVFIGGPLYGYFLLRWMVSAVVRSYFEIKREFQPQIKKEVV